MANDEKAADAQKPEAQEVKRVKGEDESVELSEKELENVAGAGPARSDDG